VVVTVDRWVRPAERSRTVTATFVGGYLTIWTACGAVAFAVLAGLQAAVPSPGAGAIRVGGLLLVAAGVYQVRAFKQACLTHCRSPRAVVAEHTQRLRQGHAGPWRVGVIHGMWCLGCCWALMGVLLLLGMVNLAWMAVLAVVMFLEKTSPVGRTLSRVVGVALILAGVVLLALPRTLPVLS
jgi:predicted metal-binding membrane protein